MKNRPVIGISLAFIIHFDHVPSEKLYTIKYLQVSQVFFVKNSYKR
jgi:hypothetical protein